MQTESLHGLKKRFLAISCALIGMLVIGVGAWTPVRNQVPQDTPQIENMTQSIQVVSAIPDATGYTLKLKNNSDKDINGYTVGSSPRSKLEVDYTIGTRVFAPGETIEARIPASHSGSTPAKVYIFAALFEDGSSDGDAKAIADYRSKRLGNKIQSKRILALLEAVLKSPDADLPVNMGGFKSQIPLLPEEPEPGQSVYMKRGLLGAKQTTNIEIERVEQEVAEGKSSYRQSLTEFRDRLIKRIARL